MRKTVTFRDGKREKHDVTIVSLLHKRRGNSLRHASSGHDDKHLISHPLKNLGP
jgi:hypothetical protein